MWVEWDDKAADLSKSRKKPGQYSPLIRQLYFVVITVWHLLSGPGEGCEVQD
jgi:hypothetical protein